MRSIKGKVTNILEVKGSKFISVLYRVDNVNCVKERLNEIKLEYKDATHYCYAYIIDNIELCSDDKEPKGSAGIPILNVLKQNELDHILCVVIRYFGGTKLGMGGLVRAYSKSVSNVLDKSSIINLEYGYKVRISFSYDNIKQINYILNDYSISYKEYDELVIYEVIVKKESLDIFKKDINKYVNNIEVLEEILY